MGRGSGSGSARVGEERGGENGDGYGGCVCVQGQCCEVF